MMAIYGDPRAGQVVTTHQSGLLYSQQRWALAKDLHVIEKGHLEAIRLPLPENVRLSRLTSEQRNGIMEAVMKILVSVGGEDMVDMHLELDSGSFIVTFHIDSLPALKC